MKLLKNKKSEFFSSDEDDGSLDEGVKPSLKKRKQSSIDDMDEYPVQSS